VPLDYMIILIIFHETALNVSGRMTFFSWDGLSTGMHDNIMNSKEKGSLCFATL
jgi:hypothetical protein